MKTIMKTTLKATLLTISLLASVRTFAGSGEGRNGPDQSGVSIPAHLDRALDYTSFRKAVKACEDEAASSLVSQMLRQKVQLVRNFRDSYVFELNSRIVIALEFDAFRSKITILDAVITPDMGNIPDFSVSPEVLRMMSDASFYKAELIGGIAVSAETKQDSWFDDLGSRHQGPLLVKSYRVSQSEIIRLTREDEVSNSGKTKLQLSAEEFNQCLQNKIN